MTDGLREEVRARYADAATAVLTGSGAACDCSHPGKTCAEEGHAFGPELYDALEDEALPEAAVLASLGCGNPTAVADLHDGETVLDLGSGGGIDVLLSAKLPVLLGKPELIAADLILIHPGAQDLLIERLSETQALREFTRQFLFEKGHMRTAKAAGAKPHSKYERYIMPEKRTAFASSILRKPCT